MTTSYIQKSASQEEKKEYEQALTLAVAQEQARVTHLEQTQAHAQARALRLEQTQVKATILAHAQARALRLEQELKQARAQLEALRLERTQARAHLHTLTLRQTA